jgi:hypothetical protein
VGGPFITNVKKFFNFFVPAQVAGRKRGALHMYRRVRRYSIPPYSV